MPIGIASTNWLQVGAVPRSMLATSTSGDSTMKTPISTSSSCVAKSITASSTLTEVDSSVPRTLSAISASTTIAPPMTSPGACRSSSQNSPPM